MQPLLGFQEFVSHRTVLDAYAKAWRCPQLHTHCALSDGEVSLAYGQLYDRVSGVAGQLHAAGIRPLQPVLVAMDRSVQSVLAILGIMAAGACPCPLDMRLTDTEIAQRLRAAGIDCIVCDVANFQRFADGFPHKVLALEHLDEAAPYWHDGVQPEDPGLLLFTSGSTGHAKGALLSHRGLLNNAIDIVRVTELSVDDRLLHVMPLNHTNGLCNQLFSPLLIGATVCLAGRFRAENMPELVQQFLPTIITAVPTMYSRMLAVEFPAAALKGLRIARCGSAPLTDALHRRIEQHFGCPLIVSYGLSEATCTSVMNPLHARKVGSIGKPMPNQRVFLKTPQGGEVTTPGAVGEICIAGSSLMLGYDGIEQDGVLQPAGEVLRTGDLGKFDEEGYLYITGRLKDIIIRGGENISPASIEEVISSHAEVKACCVVAQDNDDLGEVPVGFVVAKAGHGLTKESIQHLVSSRLSRIHQLENVFFLDSLPENAIGKIDRKVLENMANSHRAGTRPRRV